MDFTGKTVAITGGGAGIGRALVDRFVAAGARVAVGDLDEQAAMQAVGEAGFARRLNAGDQADLTAFIDAAEAALGPIDVFVANAGVGVTDGPSWAAFGADDAKWDLCWRVNVMQSVWAARRVVPGMIERGGGTVIVVASAAGLLNMVGDSAYTATKHAALAFAESMALTHADDGLRVHCVCPEGVNTSMTETLKNSVMAVSGFIDPPAVADAVFAAMEANTFLVFTHPGTQEIVEVKAAEHGRWLAGLRKMRRAIVAERGQPF